jgi:tyrosyl-tRNA synthetase
VGRDIMPGYGLEAQVVMTVPLLEGLDGLEKMSKSLGNAVGISEPPAEMFGKLMSISDELMWRYYELLTDSSLDDLAALRARVQEGTTHPKAAKAALASRIVADFHGEEAAAREADAFETRFGRGEIAPESLPRLVVVVAGDSIGLSRLVADAGLATSASDAARKIQQGGVRLDQRRVTDGRLRVEVSRGAVVLEVGRRAVVVELRSA